MDKADILDVAIVGGGISGLYTGWRLLSADLSRSETLNPADGKLNVALFELSQRVGGRLMSVTPPEMPNFKAEFGGMRFLTNQQHVKNLVDYLDLRTRPFSVSDADNIYYLRGQHLRERDFGNPDALPYKLSWLEKGKTPGKIIADAIDTIVPGAARMSKVEWQELKETFKFNGEYLYNLGFWNVLHQVMSSEAYKMLLDAGGYVTVLDNWNAAEAIPWFLADFGADVEYVTINGGMETLPLTLAEKYQAVGGTIHYGHRLHHFERIAQQGETLYRLHFEGKKPLLARHIVLAMPRRSLELIDPDFDSTYFRDPTVRKLIRSVTPHPMFKMFLCYRYPWWRDAGVDNGRSITDLPLRQVYYFGTEPDPGRFEAEVMDSLLMASYDDGRFVGFWTGLAGREYGLPDQIKTDKSRWEQLAASPLMMQHAQRQLKLLHDLEYLPEPYAAAFINWGQDPFGGAWNSWNIRVKAWEAQEQILQPLPDWQVYICGEAYSDAQGWIEGALRTAEQVLQEKFDLRRPKWL
ncbi:MAG TPA: amine oxidase [Anaerolineae bacterium]|nr:amine oxidase [Anaerolineae bacterium]